MKFGAVSAAVLFSGSYYFFLLNEKSCESILISELRYMLRGVLEEHLELSARNLSHSVNLLN